MIQFEKGANGAPILPADADAVTVQAYMSAFAAWTKGAGLMSQDEINKATGAGSKAGLDTDGPIEGAWVLIFRTKPDLAHFASPLHREALRFVKESKAKEKDTRFRGAVLWSIREAAKSANVPFVADEARSQDDKGSTIAAAKLAEEQGRDYLAACDRPGLGCVWAHVSPETLDKITGGTAPSPWLAGLAPAPADVDPTAAPDEPPAA